jgi:hypothetical protein
MLRSLFIAASIVCAMAMSINADDSVLELAEGKLTVKAPANWKSKQPSIRIIEKEFTIPSSDGDGRCTIMQASGSVQANVDRWIAQVEQPDGSSSKEKAKTATKKVGDLEVNTFDLSGTYLDRPGGPAAGGAVSKKEKYRVLAGIVNTKKAGTYFFKFYGPEKLVAENEKAFNEMLESAKEK